MPTHSLHVVRMEPLCEVEPIVEIFSLASGACSKHSFFPTLALLLIVQVSFMEDHCDLDGPPQLLRSQDRDIWYLSTIFSFNKIKHQSLQYLQVQ
jgi:hypothetical protein